MGQVPDVLLDKMVQAIVDEVDPEQVILFGSRARRCGTGLGYGLGCRGNSALWGRQGPPRRSRSPMARLTAFDMPTDLLVYSRDEVAYWRDSRNHVLAARCVRARYSISDPKQGRLLLAAAEQDFSALLGMTDTAVFADEIFGLHVQQAVEKLFKAWLALLGETYPTTHNLARLLAKLNTHDAEVERFGELLEFTP